MRRIVESRSQGTRFPAEMAWPDGIDAEGRYVPPVGGFGVRILPDIDNLPVIRQKKPEQIVGLAGNVP
ncbi:MAG: hypothetical protein AB1568_01690 [Thermodesulfobacteriota bacterium]